MAKPLALPDKTTMGKCTDFSVDVYFLLMVNADGTWRALTLTWRFTHQLLS
jgi:hypothetical protein